MAQKYLVVFTGRLRGGSTKEDVSSCLAATLDISEASARLMLDLGMGIFFESEDEGQARVKSKELEACGLKVRFQKDERPKNPGLESPPESRSDGAAESQPELTRPKGAGTGGSESRLFIVFTGRFLKGFTTLTACSGVAAVLEIREEMARQLLAGGLGIIYETADQADASKKMEELEAAGLEVRLEGKLDPELEADGPEGPDAEPEKLVTMPFEFTGTGWEYFKIWAINSLLSFATLGIYSAWAKVQRRKYFYSNTKLDGSVFEYLANPTKILKGRLLVAAMFILMWVLDAFLPLVGMVVGLAFWMLLPWLVIKSMRFNYANTAYRNVRFGFKATYGQAFKVYVLWPIVGLFSLGLFWPMVYKMQQEFLVNNTRYGQTRFEFKATGGQYFKMALGGIPLLLLALLAGWVIRAFMVAAQIPLAEFALPLSVYLLLFAYMSVKRTNLLFNSTFLDRHTFESDQQVPSYGWLLVSNTFMTALTLGIFHAWARVRTAKYKAAHLRFQASGGLADFIAGEEEKQSAFGEEMADMLDFDLGI